MDLNTNTGAVTVYHFQASKFNKHSTLFNGRDTNHYNSFITPQVKIEKFQGFSNAYNLGEYFKVRNTNNWSTCLQVTGLWETSRKGYYYGDRKTANEKTLLVFALSENREELTIYEFPTGYYPHRDTIEKLVQSI
jgi:hypothetical protein